MWGVTIRSVIELPTVEDDSKESYIGSTNNPRDEKGDCSEDFLNGWASTGGHGCTLWGVNEGERLRQMTFFFNANTIQVHNWLFQNIYTYTCQIVYVYIFCFSLSRVLTRRVGREATCCVLPRSFFDLYFLTFFRCVRLINEAHSRCNVTLLIEQTFYS